MSNEWQYIGEEEEVGRFSFAGTSVEDRTFERWAGRTGRRERDEWMNE